jgi:hypothetical protein
MLLVSLDIFRVFDLNILLSSFLNLFGIYFIYYCIIPVFNNGQTLGAMTSDIKIVFLKEYSKPQKIMILLLRALYAFVTLYAFRIYCDPKMNSIGQLYFDKRFNTTVIQTTDKVDLSKNKSYEYVTFPNSMFIKMMLTMFLGSVILSYILRLFNL